MATSKKHDEFVAKPLGTKQVEKIPGISDAIGQRMKDLNKYSKATQVVGFYMVNDFDKVKFETMVFNAGANAKNARDAYEAVQGWCDNHVL